MVSRDIQIYTVLDRRLGHLDTAGRADPIDFGTKPWLMLRLQATTIHTHILREALNELTDEIGGAGSAVQDIREPA